jgi:hypothetical protein
MKCKFCTFSPVKSSNSARLGLLLDRLESFPSRDFDLSGAVEAACLGASECHQPLVFRCSDSDLVVVAVGLLVASVSHPR